MNVCVVLFLFVSECQMPTSHHLRDNKLLLAQERMAKSTEAEEKIFLFFFVCC